MVWALQSLIPVVMAGIIAVYSLVISVLIVGDVKPPPYRYTLFEYVLSIVPVAASIENAKDEFSGFMHLGAGMSVGMTGLAAGYAIGIVGDAVRRSVVWIRLNCRLTYRRVCARTCYNREYSLGWC